jgi:aminopeptidase
LFENLAVKLAGLLVDYSLGVEKGDSVFIEGTTEAIPLINELYRKVLQVGGHPNTRVIPPGQQYIFLTEAQPHQLTYSNPFDLHLIQNVNGFIRIYSDFNPNELENIAPERMRLAKTGEREVMHTFFMRTAQGNLKWCVVPWPTQGKAQRAHMSIQEYALMIERVCFLDQEDPAGEWKKLGAKQQRLIERMNTVNELHITAPGTDLKMSVEGRDWINCAGKEDLPDGEIFTGPVEDSVNGEIYFSFPTRRAEGIRLKFKHGEVVDFSAEKGEAHLASNLEIPGARRLGEIGIGTNYSINRYVGDILCDEKMGGTIHLALGASYPESGGKNESSLHWDILTDMRCGGRITADGEVIYENGRFTL